MTARFLATLALATAVLLLLSACAGIGPGSGDPLKGTSWRLVTLRGSALIPETEITASFEDGQVGGKACNSYGGPYTVSGDKLTVGDIVRTLMACVDPPGIMEQEEEYLEMLRQASRFRVSGQELRITTRDGETLVFMASE